MDQYRLQLVQELANIDYQLQAQRRVFERYKELVDNGRKLDLYSG